VKLTITLHIIPGLRIRGTIFPTLYMLSSHGTKFSTYILLALFIDLLLNVFSVFLAQLTVKLMALSVNQNK